MQPPEPANHRNSCPNEDATVRNTVTQATSHVILMGASIRSAAQSARNAGYRVTGIDLFGDVDTRQLCDRFVTFDDLTACDRTEFDNWVSRYPAAATMRVGGLLGESARIADRIDLIRRSDNVPNPYISDSDWLRQTATESGIRFPKTDKVVLRSAKLQGRRDFAEQNTILESGSAALTSRWLLKSGSTSSPSSGGLGVRWADRWAAHESESVVRQQWIAGRSFGVSYFSDGLDVCLLGICRSSVHRIGTRPFVYAGSFGPIQLATSITAMLQRLGETIVARSQLVGLFGADVIIDREGHVTLLEINSRWTASSELVERSLQPTDGVLPGCSLIAAVIQGTSAGVIKSSIETSREPKCYAWKRIVYARHDGSFRHAVLRHATTALLRPFTYKSVNVRIADLPEDGHWIAKGEPILSLIFEFPKCDSGPRLHHWPDARRLIASVQQSTNVSS